MTKLLEQTNGGIFSKLDMQRFDGVIAIQQSIGGAKGDINTVMEAIVGEISMMPKSKGIVVDLRDADQLYYAATRGAWIPMLELRHPYGDAHYRNSSRRYTRDH